MSRTKPNDFERKMLTFVCLQCKAAKGEWCRTVGKHWAGLLHAERYYAVKRAEGKLR
jgi:hypothetical protein